MGRLAAGALVEKLYVQQVTAGGDGQGGKAKPVPVGEPVLCYAAAKVISGTEVLRLGQTLGSSVVVFTIRYRPEVTTATLATWQGRSWNIVSITHDSRREFTILTCKDAGR